jgi:hypothetical protein
MHLTGKGEEIKRKRSRGDREEESRGKRSRKWNFEEKKSGDKLWTIRGYLLKSNIL